MKRISTLNADQREAVNHGSGPILVLAGAGSGKTRVVTERIARLIRDGIPARCILAMTFTNKAANEMVERVQQLVGPSATQATIGTFHAFGLQVLRTECRYLGIADGRFAIMDQADQASILREILREQRSHRNWDVHQILSRISKAKNSFTDPRDYKPSFADPYDEITEWAYPRYMAALRSLHAFDFDDLVCEVVRLFCGHSEVLEKWQSKYWSILVDEYQDTNFAQFELVRLLSEQHRNLCVVGDDDQSIYAWRGADPRNILEFEKYFSGGKVVKLQSSYRSTEAILQVANAIICSTLARRHEKRLIATVTGGDKVRSVQADSAEAEADFIAAEIALYLQHGTPASEIAVLYRSNQQGEFMETVLRQRHIPYRMIGGTQFYERKEVKDLIAMMRIALNERDELSLRRIINYPLRGIGVSSIERLSAYACFRDISLFRAVGRACEVAGLGKEAVAGCGQIYGIIVKARQALASGARSADVAQGLIRDTAMIEDIKAASPSGEVAQRRCNNLESFKDVLSRFDMRDDRSTDELWSLLQLLTLKTEEEAAADNVVTLSTMHGAKGLEFQVVFIAGLEEGWMPHVRSMQGDDSERAGNIEQERRLFYVAVTRARRHLYLCRSTHRMVRGRKVDRAASRFLKTIPQTLLQTQRVQACQNAMHQVQMDGIAQLLEALRS